MKTVKDIENEIVKIIIFIESIDSYCDHLSKDDKNLLFREDIIHLKQRLVNRKIALEIEMIQIELCS